jgi:hypothetical protein
MATRPAIPKELTNVAEVQKSMQNDVERLKEQQEHVYTSDRADVFRDKVKEIILETLESTETYKKVSDKVQTQINTTISDNSWKFKSLWAPIIVSGAIALLGIAISAWLTMSRNDNSQPPSTKTGNSQQQSTTGQ